jgi:hypothetical protein
MTVIAEQAEIDPIFCYDNLHIVYDIVPFKELSAPLYVPMLAHP